MTWILLNTLQEESSASMYNVSTDTLSKEKWQHQLQVARCSVLWRSCSYMRRPTQFEQPQLCTLSETLDILVQSNIIVSFDSMTFILEKRPLAGWGDWLTVINNFQECLQTHVVLRSLSCSSKLTERSASGRANCSKLATIDGSGTDAALQTYKNHAREGPKALLTDMPPTSRN